MYGAPTKKRQRQRPSRRTVERSKLCGEGSSSPPLGAAMTSRISCATTPVSLGTSGTKTTPRGVVFFYAVPRTDQARGPPLLFCFRRGPARCSEVPSGACFCGDVGLQYRAGERNRRRGPWGPALHCCFGASRTFSGQTLGTTALRTTDLVTLV